MPFLTGEYYHVYSRGVEKRIIYSSPRDFERFLILLLVCNAEKPINISNLLKRYGGEPSQKMFGEMVMREYEYGENTQADTLTDVVAYALLPNHFHLILKEKREGGISKFMLKLTTAYSMYFNTKHERSGPLFTRPFRSRHIDSDEYFRWLFAYIHLNPVELYQDDWRRSGLADTTGTSSFLHRYRYASFSDYFGAHRPESLILARESLPETLGQLRSIDDLIAVLSGPLPNDESAEKSGLRPPEY